MQVQKRETAVRGDLSPGSVALARLVAEVRSGEVAPAMGAYNRTYNRHNR